MQPKILNQSQSSLFRSRLSEQLNPSHELLKLAKQIPWEQMEAEFKHLFSEGRSRPPLPIRLVTGLMILQHMFDVSDERIVEVWVENPYWQAFCGYDFLQWELPFHPTSFTRWRQRIGPAGMEKILQLSIQVALKTNTVSPKELAKTICDTTVMPKAVAHPKKLGEACPHSEKSRHYLKAQLSSAFTLCLKRIPAADAWKTFSQSAKTSKQTEALFEQGSSRDRSLFGNLPS